MVTKENNVLEQGENEMIYEELTITQKASLMDKLYNHALSVKKEDVIPMIFMSKEQKEEFKKPVLRFLEVIRIELKKYSISTLNATENK